MYNCGLKLSKIIVVHCSDVSQFKLEWIEIILSMQLEIVSQNNANFEKNNHFFKRVAF